MPDADIGLNYGEGKGLNFGFVMYHVNHASRMNLGVGFSGGKKYNIEADVMLPSFSNFSHSNYRVTVSANIFVEFFSFYFQSAYYTHDKFFLVCSDL